jgi:hypothetical protein
MLYVGCNFSSANAQQSEKTKVCVWCASNLSEQPSWGPAGYQYVYYYYLPDIDLYYYVPEHYFVYMKNEVWISSPTLPLRYAAFDFYRMYKVVINAPEPYLRHAEILSAYSSYKGKHHQPVNRDDETYKRAKKAKQTEPVVQ